MIFTKVKIHWAAHLRFCVFYVNYTFIFKNKIIKWTKSSILKSSASSPQLVAEHDCSWHLQPHQGKARDSPGWASGAASPGKTLTPVSELWLRIFLLASECFTGSFINLSGQPSRQEQQKTNSAHPNSLNNSMPPQLRTLGAEVNFLFISQALQFIFMSLEAHRVSVGLPWRKRGQAKATEPGYPVLLLMSGTAQGTHTRGTAT